MTKTSTAATPIIQGHIVMPPSRSILKQYCLLLAVFYNLRDDSAGYGDSGDTNNPRPHSILLLHFMFHCFVR